MEYSGRVACSAGVLFENSIVCLVVFVCCCFLPCLFFPFRGVMFFDASFWCLVCDRIFLIRIHLALVGGFLFGEFDSGSGRTLAACLTHASRTERPFRGYSSGERVSNTWVICPALWDKPGKLGLIPDRSAHARPRPPRARRSVQCRPPRIAGRGGTGRCHGRPFGAHHLGRSRGAAGLPANPCFCRPRSTTWVPATTPPPAR